MSVSDTDDASEQLLYPVFRLASAAATISVSSVKKRGVKLRSVRLMKASPKTNPYCDVISYDADADEPHLSATDT